MRSNRQILLRRRPRGPVSAEDFELVTTEIGEPGDGQFLVENLYLSIDPTIRGWIDRDTYMPAIPLGEVVRSSGAGRVLESNNPRFRPGDQVVGLVGWQEYALLDDTSFSAPVPPGIDPSDALGVFGINGLTAYFGLLEIGKPEAGQTVVVSGAAGATGSVAGQIGKIKGCRVVGIAGTDQKCQWLTRDLGFDAAINYKTEDVARRLRETCPDGVDVYFDNVGGPILDAVLGHLARHARVVVCGAISQYNDLSSAYGPRNYIALIGRRARMEGFLVFDYARRYSEAIMQLVQWVGQGAIAHRTSVVEGLASAPDALGRLFTGSHDGKLLVRVDHPAA